MWLHLQTEISKLRVALRGDRQTFNTLSLRICDVDGALGEVIMFVFVFYIYFLTEKHTH